MLCPETALEAAHLTDRDLKRGKDLGVLHGIPYAAKDLFDVKGLPTTAGAKLLDNNIAGKDSESIDRLSHGTPHTPWSQTHCIPGGSSSGSAVAVAAGLVPMALGTDTGGSVRNPAALCGTVGLKTTVGRISRAGVYPLSWTLDSVGVFSRSMSSRVWRIAL